MNLGPNKSFRPPIAHLFEFFLPHFHICLSQQATYILLQLCYVSPSAFAAAAALCV